MLPGLFQDLKAFVSVPPFRCYSARRSFSRAGICIRHYVKLDTFVLFQASKPLSTQTTIPTMSYQPQDHFLQSSLLLMSMVLTTTATMTTDLSKILKTARLLMVLVLNIACEALD